MDGIKGIYRMINYKNKKYNSKTITIDIKVM